MNRRRLVRVPASSANLGPGYDVMAAALALFCEVEVEEVGEFSVASPGLELPSDRSNLLVRAFESLHSADGLRFEIRSEIPLAAGLGSSAAATVAGLMAADHLFELGAGRERILELATEIEGHPDNAAASIYGGFVVCPPAGAEPGSSPIDPIELAMGSAGPTNAPHAPARLDPPDGVEAIFVIPGQPVPTSEARAAMPDEVAIADATANLAAAAHLVLGVERSDLTLIQRGLADRLHQPHRAHLYPRSMEVVAQARELGALGATISGAGPTVLVWSWWQASGGVSEALRERCGDWAEVRRVPFSPEGADVPEL